MNKSLEERPMHRTDISERGLETVIVDYTVDLTLDDEGEFVAVHVKPGCYVKYIHRVLRRPQMSASRISSVNAQTTGKPCTRITNPFRAQAVMSR